MPSPLVAAPMAVFVVTVWVRHGHITRWLLLCLACMALAAGLPWGLALLSVGLIIAIAAHDLAG